jgi:serine/threonine-protein kinase
MSDPVALLNAALQGRYTIERPLGHGGMATVYLAKDLRHERKVALKVLKPELAAIVGAERFLAEIKTTANLHHPHIVPLFDSGQADGFLFYVMPLVEGESLKERLTREKQLPIDDALEITAAVASALDYAHRHDVVHRDIKPANILLHDGHAMVADFGIALAVSAAGGSRLTQTGMSLGTPQYMSPEQAVGESDVDSRSDMYSLACVTYEMLVGEAPHVGRTTQAIVAKVITEQASRLTTRRETVPSHVDAAVHKALQKLPADRFASMADFAEALVNPGVATQTRAPARKRPALPALLGAGGLGLAVVAVVVSVLMRGGGGGAPIDSVAVLPFENTSADPDGAYLSQGITENLIDRLSELVDLRVVPRGISGRYKGDDLDLGAIGAELNVGALVTGRVGEIGDRLVVRVELIDVAELAQLWGAQYDEGIANILDVQAELVAQISRELEIRLSPEDERSLTRHDPENSEAYQLFLKSRYHTLKISAEGIARGLEYAQQAVELDPTYSLGHAALADAFLASGFQGLLPVEEAYPKARAAAQTAIDLDETVSQARLEMALVRWFVDWDWTGALGDAERAVELDPTNSDAVSMSGMFLCNMNRIDEGIARTLHAVEMDPFTPDVVQNLAHCYSYAQRNEEALAATDEVLELEPNNLRARFNRPALLQRLGEPDAAVTAMYEALESAGLDPGTSPRLARLYATMGRLQDARDIIERVDLDTADPVTLAEVFTELGEPDQAFDALERALRERSGLLPFVVRGGLVPLRDDPRFDDLLDRVGR